MNNEILLTDDKSKFMNFLETDYEGKILDLLDEEGINILKKYKYLENRICYILTYSRYCDKLFLNEKFLDLFIKSDISCYYANLRNLSNNTYDIILNRAIENKMDNYTVSRLFSYFKDDYKIDKINNWQYSNDLLYEVFKCDTKLLGSIIMNKYNIDLTSHGINIKGIFELGKEMALLHYSSLNNSDKVVDEMNIPGYMINKKLAKNIWDNNNVFKYRAIVNDAEYCCNVDIFNDYSRSMEDTIISNYNGELLKPYDELYIVMDNYIKLHNRFDNLNDKEYDEYCELRSKRISILDNIDKHISDKVSLLDDSSELYNYLCDISSKHISEYIIDYHFQENFYNIMYDLRELMNFYYAGNININNDRLEIYSKIYNIDMLSIEEKKELHEELKKYNMMEMFYDDMSFARGIVRESICDYSLTKEDILKYRDDKLSNEYGVDVYNMAGDYFFAIVKSGNHFIDDMPTGHSFSLVGKGCIATFGEPSNSDTFVYDAGKVNTNQIVHVYPMDSFTLFRPFYAVDNSKSTDRIQPLMTADELIFESKYEYNELLILESGRNNTDIDKEVPELEKMALYCVDKISSKDVMIAKKNNVGIFLVNSKDYKYKKGEKMPTDIYRHSGIDYHHYNYFDGVNYLEEHFNKR